MPDAYSHPPLAGREMYDVPPPESPALLHQSVARRSGGRLRMRISSEVPRSIAALLAFDQMHCDRCGCLAWPVELSPSLELELILCKQCIDKSPPRK